LTDLQELGYFMHFEAEEAFTAVFVKIYGVGCYDTLKHAIKLGVGHTFLAHHLLKKTFS
jgi:hypothetical protein